jgi:hypothetical protein
MHRKNAFALENHLSNFLHFSVKTLKKITFTQGGVARIFSLSRGIRGVASNVENVERPLSHDQPLVHTENRGHFPLGKKLGLIAGSNCRGQLFLKIIKRY